MTVVYIDLLFLLNLIANYLLLLAAGRMAGAALARWRIGLGAAAGALYAALIFLPGLAWLAAWPCKLASGVLMALAAYGGERYLLRVTVLFFGASAALAGVVLGLELLGNASLTLEHGVFYTPIDVRLLLLSFVACYFVPGGTAWRGTGPIENCVGGKDGGYDRTAGHRPYPYRPRR